MIMLCMTENGEIQNKDYTPKQNKQTFFGWYCETGLHSVSIKVRGMIRPTVCRQPGRSRICQIRNCFCGTDLQIPKAVDQNTLETFKSPKRTGCKQHSRIYT